MPKRSASTVQEKLLKYENKIRKLKFKELEQQRRRLRCLDSSDDEENIADMVNTEQEPHPVEVEEPSEADAPPSADVEGLPEAPTADTPTTPVSAAAEPSPPPPVPGPDTTEVTPEVTLDPEILLALGAATSDTPDFGDAIHESLAKLWTPLLRKGLSKEDKDKLLKEYLVPNNCKLLQAPKLNAEISAAVSEIVRGRDKKFVGFQQQLGAGTSAINRAMDILLSSDNKIQALKYLSDGCRILSDLHHSLTKDRIKLITPSLEKNFLHVIQDSERDDTLFGNSLSEKIKASKAIERQGSQIRKSATTQKATTSQPSTSRPVHQGNWSGPPRYPSSRGGRGGQSHRGQRPAPPQVRRAYPPPASNQTKGYGQPKTRAPLQ